MTQIYKKVALKHLYTLRNVLQRNLRQTQHEEFINYNSVSFDTFFQKQLNIYIHIYIYDVKHKEKFKYGNIVLYT
jgi:hypothetical protein